MYALIQFRDLSLLTSEIAVISGLYPKRGMEKPGVCFDVVLKSGTTQVITFNVDDRGGDVDQTTKDAEQSRAATLTQWERWLEAENVIDGCTDDNLETRQCYVKGGSFYVKSKEDSEEKSQSQDQG